MATTSTTESTINHINVAIRQLESAQGYLHAKDPASVMDMIAGALIDLRAAARQ